MTSPKRLKVTAEREKRGGKSYIKPDLVIAIFTNIITIARFSNMVQL